MGGGGWVRARWVVVPLAVMLGLWVTSSLHASPEGTLGGIPLPKVLQKLAHVVAYGTLGIAWCAVFAFRPAGRVPALALSTAYAVLDEFHQTFVPGRYGTPWDVLLDAGSAALGMAVVAVLQRRWVGSDGNG